MSGSPDPQASEYLVGAYRPLQNLSARGVAIDSGQTQDKIGEGNKMPGKSVLVLAQFLAVIRSCGIEEDPIAPRSEEHTSELQSLMRISYAVFCLTKKKYKLDHYTYTD